MPKISGGFLSPLSHTVQINVFGTVHYFLLHIYIKVEAILSSVTNVYGDVFPYICRNGVFMFCIPMKKVV